MGKGAGCRGMVGCGPNLEVLLAMNCTSWLGLVGLDGVVFLNENDERMVLERSGLRVVTLLQSGLSSEKRFTFYDHVHTIGMDIKQPLFCTAALTLGKDMSFPRLRSRCIQNARHRTRPAH